MAAYQKTETLVLHATRWRESSKIVRLFSAEHGLLTVVAKGALRPKSPFRGVLESLNHVEIVITHRENRDLQTLTAVTLINAFHNIRQDLPKTAVAFSILELLKKLFAAHEPVRNFFRYTTSLLASLDQHPGVLAEGYLWHFLLNLSETLGFGWNLKSCRQTGQPPRHFPVALDFQHGELICLANPEHYSPHEVLLTRSQWEQLLRMAETPVTQLDRLVAIDSFFNHAGLTGALLKHIEFHTESRLELKSLNWYV